MMDRTQLFQWIEEEVKASVQTRDDAIAASNGLQVAYHQGRASALTEVMNRLKLGSVAQITNPTAEERQTEVRERLLLAISIITGRRDSLTAAQSRLLLVPRSMHLWSEVVQHCEHLIVSAIVAGGYR